MNFSRGKTGTKVRCESRLFSQEKTPEFTTAIHELFVLALSLVWFAGATPENRNAEENPILGLFLFLFSFRDLFRDLFGFLFRAEGPKPIF